MGNISSHSNCAIKSSMLFVALSAISWSFMSFAFAMTDAEGSSSSTVFNIITC